MYIRQIVSILGILLFGFISSGHSFAQTDQSNTNVIEIYNEGAAAFNNGDFSKALSLSKMGCGLGGRDSCYLNGYLWERGDAGKVDLKIAAKSYRQACAGDHQIACFEIGRLSLHGTGVPKNETDARQLFNKSCELGDIMGCNFSGSMMFEGLGGAKDYVGARANLKRACDAENLSACAQYGDMLAAGEGGPVDLKLARKTYYQVCDNAKLEDNPQAACLNLASMSENAMGGPVDNNEIQLGYYRACRWDNGDGCEKFAEFIIQPVQIAKWDGLLRDFREGLQYECLGDKIAQACTGWAKMIEKGAGIDADPEMAKKAYEMGCEMGDTKACRI